jgi:uncharacterized LabA/DUF88 family protein
MSSTTKVGVYVDLENFKRSGGFGMQYDVLRKFACREGAETVRLNAYAGFDKRRALIDPLYEKKTRSFFSIIRDFGFKVIEKEVKWFRDEDGKEYAKANADLDMAVDALLQSENLDRVLMATGDGDFVQVIRALQNKGCRVEVVAFSNVSSALRQEADMFISGYLIPNLLPPIKPSKEESSWGEIGSRVRGTCYHYNHSKSFGYMRFLKDMGPLWITDHRDVDSPYKTAYFHNSMVLDNIDYTTLPSRNYLFEFKLSKSALHEGEFQAEDINLICRLS